jgi:hypothetical protein
LTVNVAGPSHPRKSKSKEGEQEKDKRIDVRLGGKGLGDEVIRCVFNALSKAHLIAYVRDVDVHANHLTCDGAVAICDAFLGTPRHRRPGRKNAVFYAMQVTVLKVLNLSHNAVGARGAERLADLLRCCTAVEVLDLFANPLGEAGCTALAVTLTLPPPEFEEDDDVLAEAQEEKDGMAEGDADGSSDPNAHLPLDSPMKMAPVDPANNFNRSLAELRLGATGIGSDALRALHEALETNRSLHTLVLDDCPHIPSARYMHVPPDTDTDTTAASAPMPSPRPPTLCYPPHSQRPPLSFPPRAHSASRRSSPC